MSIPLDIFCLDVPFNILFDAMLSVGTGVGGCEWPIYAREVCTDVAFWQFSNNPPNSDSVADARTFLTILYYTCTGPFYGRIAVTGVLHFGPRKNIHVLCFVPLVLRCRMHMNICGESFRLFCILLLILVVMHCNLIIVRYVLYLHQGVQGY